MQSVGEVQYGMLYEWMLAEWMAVHARLPELLEATERLNELMPGGLGVPVCVPRVDRPFETWNWLYRDVVVLQEAVRRASSEHRSMQMALQSLLDGLRSRIAHLSRKVDSFALRGAQAGYVIYDTFSSYAFIGELSGTSVDTLRGELRLHLTTAHSVPMRMVRDGRLVYLESDDYVEVSGVRVAVYGRGYLTIDALTEEGWLQVFYGALSGEDLVEFGLHRVKRLRLEHDGEVLSVRAVRRGYAPSGYMQSVEAPIPGSTIYTALRLRMKADVPEGTSVSAQVRVKRGSSWSRWRDIDAGVGRADSTLLNPRIVNQVLTEWTSTNYGTYRCVIGSGQHRPVVHFILGSDQWLVEQHPAPGGVDYYIDNPTYRPAGEVLSLYATPRDVAVSSSADGLITGISTDPSDVRALLYRTDIGGRRVIIASIAPGRLPQGMYIFRSWVKVESSQSLKVSLARGSGGTSVNAAMYIDGNPVIAFSSVSRLEHESWQVVQVQQGWHEIAVTVAGTSGLVYWSVDREVQAFPDVLEEVQVANLRHNSYHQTPSVSIYRENGSWYVETNVFMSRGVDKDLTGDPPAFTMYRLDTDVSASAVQVRIYLYSNRPDRTPVVDSYQLEMVK